VAAKPRILSEQNKKKIENYFHKMYEIHYEDWDEFSMTKNKKKLFDLAKKIKILKHLI
jgi:hypothetical protein